MVLAVLTRSLLSGTKILPGSHHPHSLAICSSCHGDTTPKGQRAALKLTVHGSPFECLC
jgi:hypothetical protein